MFPRPQPEGQPPSQRRRVLEASDIESLNNQLVRAVAEDKVEDANRLIGDGANAINEAIMTAISRLLRGRVTYPIKTQFDMLKMLLAEGASQNAPASVMPKNKTLLAGEIAKVIASVNQGNVNNVEILHLLLDDKWGRWPRSLLDQLLTQTTNLYAIDILVRKGADVNANGGATLLGAVKRNDFQLVSYLLDGGAGRRGGGRFEQKKDLFKVNTKDPRLLASAIENGSVDMVRLLLINGLLDVTPQHMDLARRKNNPAIVNMLSNVEDLKVYGPDGILKDEAPQLIDVVEEGDVQLAKKLIDAGYDVHEEYEEALKKAVDEVIAEEDGAKRRERIAMIKMLLTEGADPTIEDADFRPYESAYAQLLQGLSRAGDDNIEVFRLFNDPSVLRGDVLHNVRHDLDIDKMLTATNNRQAREYLISLGADVNCKYHEDYDSDFENSCDDDDDEMFMQGTNISVDNSRFGGVDAQNQKCINPTDGITRQPIPPYAMIRILTRDGSGGIADSYHCFDVRSLNNWVNTLGKGTNPVTDGVFSQGDMRRIKERAEQVERQYHALD